MLSFEVECFRFAKHQTVLATGIAWTKVPRIMKPYQVMMPGDDLRFCAAMPIQQADDEGTPTVHSDLDPDAA